MGAAIGSQNFTNDYLRDKVEEWSNELSSLEAAAKTEPHLAHIALVKVIQSRWNFIMRTIPGSERHMQPLEAKLRNVISLLVDRTLSDLERDIIALPCSAGGLGLINPTECASRFYENSVKLTNRKTQLLLNKILLTTRIELDEQKFQDRTVNMLKKPSKLCIPEVRMK